MAPSSYYSPIWVEKLWFPKCSNPPRSHSAFKTDDFQWCSTEYIATCVNCSFLFDARFEWSPKEFGHETVAWQRQDAETPWRCPVSARPEKITSVRCCWGDCWDEKRWKDQELLMVNAIWQNSKKCIDQVQCLTFSFVLHQWTQGWFHEVVSTQFLWKPCLKPQLVGTCTPTLDGPLSEVLGSNVFPPALSFSVMGLIAQISRVLAVTLAPSQAFYVSVSEVLRDPTCSHCFYFAQPTCPVGCTCPWANVFFHCKHVQAMHHQIAPCHNGQKPTFSKATLDPVGSSAFGHRPKCGRGDFASVWWPGGRIGTDQHRIGWEPILERQAWKSQDLMQIYLSSESLNHSVSHLDSQFTRQVYEKIYKSNGSQSSSFDVEGWVSFD